MRLKAREIIDRIEEIIVSYNKNRDKLDDDTISELRATLSTGTYLFVESAMLPAMEDAIVTDIAERKTEATVFQQLFDNLIKEGFSKSQAESMARKLYLGNEEYLEAVKQNKNAQMIVKIYDTLLKQANQVLNSMAKRINYT